MANEFLLGDRARCCNSGQRASLIIVARVSRYSGGADRSSHIIDDDHAFRRGMTADALPVGNIAATWSPSSGFATIHHLRIWRDGKSIDVLKTVRFAVVRQEVMRPVRGWA